MEHVLNLTQNQTSSLTTPSLPVEWLKKINLGGKWIFIGRIKMFLGLYLIWERVPATSEAWVPGVIETST